MQVKEVMEKPTTIDKDISLVEAAKMMSDKNLDCLIYLSNNTIKGIITERDILKNFKDNKKVSQFMSKDVIVIESKKDLNVALRMMQDNKIKRLPVIEKGQLVGIVSATDLLANTDELDEPFFF